MFELIDQLLASLNLRVCESVDVPDRSEGRGRVPKAIADGRVLFRALIRRVRPGRSGQAIPFSSCYER